MRSCFAIRAVAVGLFWMAGLLPAQFNSTQFNTTQFNPSHLINSFGDGASGSRIGVALRDIDADRAAVLKLGSVSGVEVLGVEPGSPAEQAGIRAGDVLLSYNNESIIGAQQLGRLVSETPVGRKVKIEYFRDGKVTTVSAITSARPTGAMPFGSLTLGSNGSFEAGANELLWNSSIPSPLFAWTNQQLGIECESLDSHNSQLADFFGVKRGVLVRSVVKDSPAAKAGLRAGDVVTQIGGRAVADLKDIASYLRQEQHMAKPFALEVMREHKPSTLKVTVAPDSQE